MDPYLGNYDRGLSSIEDCRRIKGSLEDGRNLENPFSSIPSYSGTVKSQLDAHAN